MAPGIDTFGPAQLAGTRVLAGQNYPIGWRIWAYPRLVDTRSGGLCPPGRFKVPVLT